MSQPGPASAQSLLVLPGFRAFDPLALGWLGLVEGISLATILVIVFATGVASATLAGPAPAAPAV